MSKYHSDMGDCVALSSSGLYNKVKKKKYIFFLLFFFWEKGHGTGGKGGNLIGNGAEIWPLEMGRKSPGSHFQLKNGNIFL